MVRWYFRALDRNGSGDVGKKELKALKRFLRKKAKPRKCVRRFVEYCDAGGDRGLSLPELMGCLGVGREREDSRASARRPQGKWGQRSKGCSHPLLPMPRADPPTRGF